MYPKPSRSHDTNFYHVDFVSYGPGLLEYDKNNVVIQEQVSLD
jgi:hypothetical protein